MVLTKRLTSQGFYYKRHTINTVKGVYTYSTQRDDRD